MSYPNPKSEAELMEQLRTELSKQGFDHSKYNDDELKALLKKAGVSITKK